ncbi:unnamed protein product, partial [Closterium sp. NIES-53]
TGAGGARTRDGGAEGADAEGSGTEETGAGGSPPPRYYTRLQALHRLEREEQERQQLRYHYLLTVLRFLLQTRLRLFSLLLSHSHLLLLSRTTGPFVVPRVLIPRLLLPTSTLPCFVSALVVLHQSLFSRHLLRPVVSRVLTSVVIDPRASPSSVSTLTAAITDFASTRRLDFATRVVAAPPARPEAAGGGFALGCDVLEDRQFELDFLADASPSLCAMLLSPEGDPDALDIPTLCTYREAVSGEWASQWKAAMDSELASWRSTGTYVDAVPPPKANVVDGMWLFKVKWPPGSPPVFKARYVARGFSQREGVDFFHSFAPTPKMTTLRGHLHEEIWLRRPPGFTDTFPPGTQWSLRRPVYGLRQSPREWHDTLRSTLRNLGFRPSSADPSLFVRTGSTPFFILVYVLRQFGFQFSTTQPTPLVVDQRLTDPFPDEPFESSGPYAKLVGCLILGAGAVSWRSTRSSSVASSSAGAEIYAGAMAAQELRWLTFLLADLGERPRSAPTLYADNKVMILLCREPRLESRVKHIDVKYFLLRELQRRGQARLDIVASEANTADVFTKALAPDDHHKFCVQLGLVEVGPRLQ